MCILSGRATVASDKYKIRYVRRVSSSPVVWAPTSLCRRDGDDGTDGLDGARWLCRFNSLLCLLQVSEGHTLSWKTSTL